MEWAASRAARARLTGIQSWQEERHGQLPSSLAADLHELLREEAELSGQPATVLAREALRMSLAERRRRRLHSEIAAFAAEHGGSALDLDEDLERAAGEALQAAER
jgi:hypothetical protein